MCKLLLLQKTEKNMGYIVGFFCYLHYYKCKLALI